MTLPRLLVIGAGGHAKVVIEAVTAAAQWRVSGCTSAEPTARGSKVAGVEVLGSDEVWSACLRDGISAAVVAIGGNDRRREISAMARQAGFRLPAVVHPTAWVSPSAQLGSGCVIMAGAVIQADAIIGDDVIVNTMASVDHDCVIGAAVHLAPGVRLAGGVDVGEGALVGIGASAVPNAKIGAWSVVGAGATVVSRVPEHRTAIGTPARCRE